MTTRISKTARHTLLAMLASAALFRPSPARADTAEAIKELNLSGPPKPAHEKQPMPDVPSSRVTVTIDGQNYDLAADYKPDSAKKRLFVVVSQLAQEAQTRLADASKGSSPLANFVPGRQTAKRTEAIRCRLHPLTTLAHDEFRMKLSFQTTVALLVVTS